MKFLSTVLVLASLAGCSVGPTLEIVQNAEVVQAEDIFFVTTRAPSQTTALFSEVRAQEPTYGAIKVGIPPVHQIGQLEITDDRPDPARHFHNAGARTYRNAEAFRRAVTQNDEPVVIFVHGFNNTFAESTFRLAQIAHDIGREGTAVNLSWASRGTANGYIYDRDSAMLARDELADLLVLLSVDPQQQITVVGHSLGTLVVMEAILQLSLQRQAGALASINQILLISPDLDADLFLDQIAQISYPAEQMVLAINPSDRMLAISRHLSGNQRRVGRDMNAQELTDAGFSVIDLSRINDGDRAGHFLMATSPTLLGFMRSVEGRAGARLP